MKQQVLLVQQLLLCGGGVLSGFGVSGCRFLCQGICRLIDVHVALVLLATGAPQWVLLIIAAHHCWVLQGGPTLCCLAHPLSAHWAGCPVSAPRLVALAAEAHVGAVVGVVQSDSGCGIACNARV